MKRPVAVGGGGKNPMFAQTEALLEVGGSKDSATSVAWGEMRGSLRRQQGVVPSLQHHGELELGKMWVDLCEGRNHASITTLLLEPVPTHSPLSTLLQP